MPAEPPDPKGLIFDVERFALHDGPGVRTTVFFKGCPLSCWWCHNPEAISPRPELVRFASRCIGCGECLRVCSHGAHELRPDGTRVHHPQRCTLCGRCVEACDAGALVMEGRQVTVDELMAQLRRDEPFYRDSGGGVTLSGGEPLLQHEFALALLRACKAEGLHTALDTSGLAPWTVLAALLPYADLVLYDVKQIDDSGHRQHTGRANGRILANLERLAASGTPVVVRLPIVPGVNDADGDIARTAAFLAGIGGICRVDLLAYHELGRAKYARLGRPYRLPDLAPPSPERMAAFAEVLRARGLDARVGG